MKCKCWSIFCAVILSILIQQNIASADQNGMPIDIDSTCEKRAPYLIYTQELHVQINEPIETVVSVDGSDCPKARSRYDIDYEGDGTFEESGIVKGGEFILRHTFHEEGTYHIKGSVKNPFGATPLYIQVTVTDLKETGKQSPVSKSSSFESFAGLLPEEDTGPQPLSAGSDGIRNKRAVLVLASTEERFWIDINLAYHVLNTKYSFTDSEIILLTPDTNIPASLTAFDIAWIDGTSDRTSIETIMTNLADNLDGDDLLFFAHSGHGSGYYGPNTRRPYFNGTRPSSIYQGPIGQNELVNYDDPDYSEEEFTTELVVSGQVNCVIQSSCPKGMNTFMPCFDYYSCFLAAGDTMYRFKVVSHFDNVPLLDSSLASDNDIYLEKIISYAKCDENRNTIIEDNEVPNCDWDNDGIILYDSMNGFDEDDWVQDAFSIEEGYHPYYSVNGLCYCLVDKNLDNTIDLIGFQSCTDPLLQECLAQTADPANLSATGTDTDNDGYSNFLDLNLDSDTDDYISFDEALPLPASLGAYDDDISAWFALFNSETTKIFITESCFSGGYLRDLSGPNMISISASEEDDTSSGNYFIRHFFMALNNGCEQFGSPTLYPGYDCINDVYYNSVEQGLDYDNDSLISIAEAFRRSYDLRVPMDFPMYDDNADLVESYGDSLTFFHEYPAFLLEATIPEGIYGDSIFLDEFFFGDISQVACFDFDGPLNFATLSDIVNYGQYTSDFDYPDGTSIDFVCDGTTGTSFTLDSIQPASIITSPTDGSGLIGQSFIISGTATDNVSDILQVEVSTDNGLTWNLAVGTNSWSYVWTLSGAGSYIIKSRARDVAGNVEVPTAGITVTVCTDNDLDNYAIEGGVCGAIDCDDNNANTYPGANEICDGEDNNCDTQVDEGVVTTTYFEDLDSDGFGSDVSTVACSAPNGFVSISDDCNDSDQAINPAAEEVCDGVDNNCDGYIDEGFDQDADGDGYTLCYDCDDTNKKVNPGKTEEGVAMCKDGIDNDCDGFVDGADSGCGGSSGPEICDDGIDNDGDGDIDCLDSDCPACPPEICNNGVDDDMDGAVDCLDSDCPPCPSEVCNNGVDDDMDGDIDCDDSDCTGDPACPTCGPTGSPCTSNADCCASCNKKTGLCR